MNIQYLGNHAERLKDISQINTPGEIYVVGRDKDAFIAFRLPYDDKKILKSDDELIVKNIKAYEAVLDNTGNEIMDERTRDSQIVIDGFIDIEHMGVFRPTKGSRLRKILEEKLPKITKAAE